MNSIPQKTCSRCMQTKPVTEFRKGKGYADGYRSKCKACLNAENREYSHRPESRERQRNYQREYQHRPDVKTRVRAYFHRPDVNERVKERERQRWANDAHLREYKRVYLRERYRNNPEHKRKQIAHSMAAIHARRAKLKKNGGSYSAKQWRELCAKYGHVCLCCGKAEQLTPDHIVPIDSGGSGDISNIQPLCLPCNLRKATKTIDYRPTQPPTEFG